MYTTCFWNNLRHVNSNDWKSAINYPLINFDFTQIKKKSLEYWQYRMKHMELSECWLYNGLLWPGLLMEGTRSWSELFMKKYQNDDKMGVLHFVWYNNTRKFDNNMTCVTSGFFFFKIFNIQRRFLMDRKKKWKHWLHTAFNSNLLQIIADRFRVLSKTSDFTLNIRKITNNCRNK